MRVSVTWSKAKMDFFHLGQTMIWSSTITKDLSYLLQVFYEKLLFYWRLWGQVKMKEMNKKRSIATLEKKGLGFPRVHLAALYYNLEKIV